MSNRLVKKEFEKEENYGIKFYTKVGKVIHWMWKMQCTKFL